MAFTRQRTVRTIAARFGAVALVSASLAVAGCTTVPDPDEPEVATLVTARAGDDVTLQWKTEPGMVYSVVYTEKLSGGTWDTVSGIERVEGTGGIVQFKDRVPAGVPRYYRLKAVHAAEK